MLFFLLLVVLLPIVELAEIEDECSSFPYVTLEHGKITRIGPQYYSFSCNKGYYLASRPQIRCYNGNWTSSPRPQCFRNQGLCDEPPTVPNAVVHGTDREPGARLRYTCKPGFQLIGKGEMTCIDGGFWKGRTPTCMDESEPLQKVAERLKNGFVEKIETYTNRTGRLLDTASTLEGLELVILIDRSSSLDPVHLQDAKKFVKFLLKRFDVKNGANTTVGTRAAVITFGTKVKMVFNVDNRTISSPKAAGKAIDAIEPNGGGTNMEGALTKVIIKVTGKLRPNAKRALFLMTDGEPNIAHPEITPQDLARTLNDTHGFEIFTVGIGSGINRRLLSEIASEPPLSHVFVLSEYPELNKIIEVIKDERPPPPPISANQCGHKGPGEDRPWLAVVFVIGQPIRVCGGVLICREWILTAASCLQEDANVTMEDIFVSLGKRELATAEKGQTNFYAVHVEIHPGFNPSNPLVNNLALIKLDLSSRSATYRPACLPRTDRQIPMHLDPDINASIAGWGRNVDSGPTLALGSDIYFKMDSISVSLSEEGKCPGYRPKLPLICAGQGPQTCLGLLGSPLMTEDSSTGFSHVLGIAAGRKHCLRGENQYIELTTFIRWINERTVGCQFKHWDIEN